MTGEGEQHDGQNAEHDDVDGTIDGDEAEHVAVTKHRTPRREFDLVAGGHPRRGRILGNGEGSQASQRRQRCQRMPSRSRATAESSGVTWAASMPTRTWPDQAQVNSS